MAKLKPVTPGELLLEEFLRPMGISQYRLAKEIGVPGQRIGEIVAGKRAVTADTDLRLCRFFGLSNGYWLRAQATYDTEVAEEAPRGGTRKDQAVDRYSGVASLSYGGLCMTWTDIRRHYPHQWLLIEALLAHSKAGTRFLDELAVIDAFADGETALRAYLKLHRDAPLRELYVVHSDREELEITERSLLGLRTAG